MPSLTDKVNKVPPGIGEEKEQRQDNTFSNQILILFSAPLLTEDLSPVENLSIKKEINAIVEVLEDISHPIAMEIVVKVATSQTLQDAFSSRMKPLIIHFIGHGTTEGDGTALVLEDEVGIARAFSEEELEISLSNHKKSPCQLALLNACHSEKLAEAFITVGVDHVIAVNAEDKILDLAARCFSRRLYQALFNQDAVVDSFLVSRNAVKLDDKLKKLFNAQTFQQGVNFDEAFKFKLLPPTPHNQALIIEPASSHQIISPQWSPTNLTVEDPNFVGRREEIHQVVKCFVESDNRCLALHGMGGIGKTSLAKAIGHWFHQRDRYKDGVWLISLRDTNSVGTLITRIKQELELKSFSLGKELRQSFILLILDDLDKLLEKEADELIEFLNSLLENCSNLRLLLTCRDSLVSADFNCQQQEVCSMEISATREIFSNYAPPQDKWGNRDLAEDFELLVQFLDGYPLAIKLAASYMKQTQYNLKRLLKKLDTKALKVLDSPRAKKETSLRITLEISFERLSVNAQDFFSWLAFFPSGLSMDLAEAIDDISGEDSLLELFQSSMAEKSLTATDWRVNLPEPARSYAESKLQPERKLDYLAPLVLGFYYKSFWGKIIHLFDSGKDKEAQELLLQESSNLMLFLQWGYDHENSTDNICRSARITASLSPYWRWFEPNQDPLARLGLALVAAKRNYDKEGENLVREAITELSSQGEFKDIQTLGEETDNLKTFEFETVTVNFRGEEIKREKHSAQYFTEIIFNDIPLETAVLFKDTTVEMVAIPSGTFMMGSPEGEGYDREKPQHQVTVKSFFMGKYLITQAQWRAVAKLPKVKRYLKPNPARFKGDNRPVEQVSWNDAVEFCARLSKATDREYRLPSEAEWEYACRAGTTTPFYCGETLMGDLANYRAISTYVKEPQGNYRKGTTTVGVFPPNAFGLYDMHGNLWEWCADHWHENYQGAPTDGSTWIDVDDKSYYINRGSSWDFDPRYCRSACRYYYGADSGHYSIGFRVVCVLGLPNP